LCVQELVVNVELTTASCMCTIVLLTTGSGDFQNKLFGEAQGMPYKRVRFDMPDNDFADVDMLTPEQLNAPSDALAEHQVCSLLG
jgi:hypothetical protein